MTNDPTIPTDYNSPEGLKAIGDYITTPATPEERKANADAWIAQAYATRMPKEGFKLVLEEIVRRVI